MCVCGVYVCVWCVCVLFLESELDISSWWIKIGTEVPTQEEIPNKIQWRRHFASDPQTGDLFVPPADPPSGQVYCMENHASCSCFSLAPTLDKT